MGRISITVAAFPILRAVPLYAQQTLASFSVSVTQAPVQLARLFYERHRCQRN